jgi:aromatic-L-amino-acid decarboxylase
MDIEEFRRQGHRMVDWMADYLANVEDLPVRAQCPPGSIAEQLSVAPPLAGEAMDDIFADFKNVVMPGMTHWQHPRFMAYFPANSSPPAVLAEMLTATLAAQCMLWQTSPAATEMETRVLDWLRQMLDLPVGLSGVIQDSASTANLCALLVARERVSDWQSNEAGMGQAPAMAVYCSTEAHSSVEKGVKIAGYGVRNLRQIPVDENFAMRADALAAAIAADLAAGIRPACIVACIGTTGVGACDPLAAIAAIAKAHDIFLHVDAAWAGNALILPEQRHLIEGIEAADSFVFNPHKWLLTNFDCSAHFVKDVPALLKTFSILPAYLHSRETG